MPTESSARDHRYLLTYTQYWIGRHQLKLQKFFLESELERVRLVNFIVAERTLRLTEEINVQIAAVARTQKSWEETPHHPRYWLDDIKIWMYKWATKDRFKGLFGDRVLLSE